MTKWTFNKIIFVLLVGCAPLLGGPPRAWATEPEQQDLPCQIEPRSTIKLGAAVPGLISEVLVDRGDVVKAGQVVAKLESGVEETSVALAEVRAKNDYQIRSNHAKKEYHKRKLLRDDTLRRANVIAEKTRDESETDSILADLAEKEAEINLRISELELAHQHEILKQRSIRTPVSGIIVEKNLSAGEYAHDANYVLKIAQVDPLNVEVVLPLSFFGKTPVGTQAEVFPEPPVGGRYAATVAVVDPVIHAESGTVGVRLEVRNPDFSLPAGVRCKIRFTETLVRAPGPDRSAFRDKSD